MFSIRRVFDRLILILMVVIINSLVAYVMACIVTTLYFSLLLICPTSRLEEVILRCVGYTPIWYEHGRWAYAIRVRANFNGGKA
jgi:hypothetical protein